MNDTSKPNVDLKHLNRVANHLLDTDDITLITLKGHLLIEELLDEIIWAHCKSPETMHDVEIRFPAKVKLVLALTGTHELTRVWGLCEKLNTLRNSLAHKIENPAAQKKLDTFFSGFNDPFFTWQPNARDVTDLRDGIVFLIGAIQGIRNPLVNSEVKTAL